MRFSLTSLAIVAIFGFTAVQAYPGYVLGSCDGGDLSIKGHKTKCCQYCAIYNRSGKTQRILESANRDLMQQCNHNSYPHQFTVGSFHYVSLAKAATNVGEAPFVKCSAVRN
ncbi:hypothetical protein BGX26_008515 [Mortierella sp. AD094]|nr:hypothetical protein BGX26_008515 [Mortierella sp. AD094]